MYDLHDDTATREADLRPLEPLAEPFRVVLLVSIPGGKPQAFELGTQRSLSLGRAEPADVQLADPSLSRLHARFSCEGDCVRVMDLGSRNGTWVRGERVRDAVLRPGDLAVVGSATVSVQLTASPSTAMLGLLSGDAVLRRIEEEWTRAYTFRRSLAVIALRTLRKGEVSTSALAETCLGRLRPVDCAGLYDRSALLVVLPETRASDAAQLAKAWCAPVRGRGQVVCGVAVYPEAGSTPEQLVSAAWRASGDATLGAPVFIASSVQLVRDSLDDEVVRKSQSTLELERMVGRLASRPLSVLITGETGTGKELVARELHQRGPRSSGPLKIVNCAAIPDTLIESVLFGHEKGAFTGADREHRGVFEQAHGGTVFLDEVGELSAEAQGALLRVLDSARLTRIGGSAEIATDVRVVAATHRDLLALAEVGAFRLDLYHRLNAVTLTVPPLRDRPEEIEPLAEYFLASTVRRWGGAVLSITPEAIECLRAYRWPGNVRELRNVIERAVALADGSQITVADLPEHMAMSARMVATESPPPPAQLGPLALRASLHSHEAQLIREALDRCGGNQRKAAGLLQIPLRTFQRRISQLDLGHDDK